MLNKHPDIDLNSSALFFIFLDDFYIITPNVRQVKYVLLNRYYVFKRLLHSNTL